MIVRELITLLGFQLDDADAKKASQIFKGLVGASAALVASVTAAAAAIALIAANAANAGEDIENAATKFGLTTDEVQELQHVAASSGVSFESMGIGLKNLNRLAGDAAGGSKEAANKFRQFGIDIRDGNGKLKPTGVLLQDVANKIKSAPNAMRQTAIAMGLLGKSGNELLPVLEKGGPALAEMMGEAHTLGNVLSKEALVAVGKLDTSLDALGAASHGLSLRFGAGVAPAVTIVTDALKNLLINNRELIDRGIKALGDALVSVASVIASFIETVDEHKVLFAALTGILAVFAGVALASVTAALWAAVPAAAALGTAIWAGLAPIIAIAAPIIALGILLALIAEDIWVFSEGGDSAIGELLKSFKLLGIWISEWSTGLWDDITGAFSSAFNWLSGLAKSVFALIAKQIIGPFQPLIDFWLDMLAMIGSAIQQASSFVAGVLGSVANSLIGFWTGVLDSIGSVIDSVTTTITDGFMGAVTWLVGLWTGFFEWLGGIFDTASGFASSKLIDPLMNLVSGLIGFWKDRFLEFFNFISTNVPTPLKAMLGGVGGVADALTGMLGSPTPSAATLPAMAGSSNSTAVNMGGATVSVQVNGTNASAADIGQATKQGVMSAQEQTAKEFSDRFAVVS